jgi:hypothetical protein
VIVILRGASPPVCCASTDAVANSSIEASAGLNCFMTDLRAAMLKATRAGDVVQRGRSERLTRVANDSQEEPSGGDSRLAD